MTVVNLDHRPLFQYLHPHCLTQSLGWKAFALPINNNKFNDSKHIAIRYLTVDLGLGLGLLLNSSTSIYGPNMLCLVPASENTLPLAFEYQMALCKNISPI